jgi:cyclic pyranopterin phosphate synthase
MSRQATYLRVSVTDGCDRQCVYCRPAGDRPQQPRHTLTCRQVVHFVQAAAACGIGKVRLTGGEPLLHEDIVEIVRGVRAVDGIRRLGLTTNGHRLAAVARDLRRAGLPSVNISLPSLRETVYRQITGGRLQEALDGLEAALREGFAPVKLNVVVLRGTNDDEIEPLARLAESDPVEVRFIECMPFRRTPGIENPLVPSADVLERLRSLGQMDAEGPGDRCSSARMFGVRGFRGKVGVISPMTQPFCSSCNRIRLTADGMLRSCLVDGGKVDVRPALLDGFDRQALLGLIQQAMTLKPALHSATFRGVMTCIGG